MRKFPISLLFFVIILAKVNAQLGTAPNFSLTDINDEEFNLYEILDENKLVILSIGATWSAASLDFHNQLFLEELYAEYGPSGTDQIRILFVECDPNTTLDDLLGAGDNTIGDWMTNISYPIANPQFTTFPFEVFATRGLPAVKIINPTDYELVEDISCAESKSEIAAAINELITLITPISATHTVHNPTCYEGEDGSISLNIFGGLPPYDIQWENGSSGQELTNLVADIYIYQLTDANNTLVSDTIMLSEPEALTLTATTTPEINGQSNGNISLTIMGGVSPYNVLWSTENTEPEISNLASGEYAVTVSDENECAVDTTFIVDFYSSYEDFIVNEIVLFPNPSQDNIYLHIPLIKQTESVLECYNALGQTVFSIPYQAEIEIAHLTKGIYFLSLKNEKEKVLWIGKFTKM